MRELSALEILEKLVSFPTVSDRSNLELIDWVENYLNSFQIETYRKYNEDGTISNDGGDSMDVDVREAATNILKGMNNNITTNNNHNSKTLADGSNDDSSYFPCLFNWWF